MRILFFGDSIVWGGYDRQGGWVDRLKREVIVRFLDGEVEKHQVFNLGVGSEASDGLCRRIEAEIVARQLPGKECAVFIAIGANDSQLSGENKVERVTLQGYRENLRTIAAIAKKYSKYVCIVGLTAVRDDNVRSKDLLFSNERIKQYDQVLNEIAEAEQLTKIEIFEHMIAAGPANLLIADGLHPNDAGHELIAGLVRPELEKLLA